MNTKVEGGVHAKKKERREKNWDVCVLGRRLRQGGVRMWEIGRLVDW